MNMYINETWNNDLILTFNYGKTFLGKGGRNGNNTAFGNGNIHILESSIPENSPAGQQLSTPIFWSFPKAAAIAAASGIFHQGRGGRQARQPV